MNVCDSKTPINCIGCGACASACPLNLINIESDPAGFYKAVMNNAERCADCGKCLKVCPALNAQDNSRQCAFYGYSANSDDRLKGTSGGIFTSVAKDFVKRGGVVFGAVLNSENGQVSHMSSEEADISRMSGSKYVQSNTFGVFEKIKSELEADKDVLFCGTPCQVSGLLRFLGKEYANLLTMDFICHGVPSAKLFADYYADLNPKNKKLSDYDFRSKVEGWGRIRVSYRLNDKAIYKKGSFDPYNHLFEKGISVNPACYECAYRINHFADITVGDFWQYRKAGLTPEEVKDGMSLCVANTKKGVSFLTNADNLCLSQMDLKYSDYAFKPLNKSGEDSIKFYEDYSTKGYTCVKKKYASNLLYKSIRGKIKSVIKKFL